MKKLIKPPKKINRITRTIRKNNPFNTSPTTDPIKAFEAGILDGKEFYYKFIMEENDRFTKNLSNSKWLSDHEFKDEIIRREHERNINSLKKILKDLLNEPNFISAIIELENPNFDVSKLHYLEAFALGEYLGKKKAIEYAISKNFDADLIRNQWFIVADKIENFEE